MKESSKNWAYLSIGALLGEPGGGGAAVLGTLKDMWRTALEMGNLEGAHLPGTLRSRWRALERERFSLWDLLLGERGGRAPLLGTLKDMWSKVLETDVFFRRGPVLGKMEGLLLSKGLREKGKLFYQENFYWGIRETYKRRLWKQATLSVGAPLGNLEGGSFTGGLWHTVIFRLLFLDPEDVRSLSLGTIWNFSRGLSLPLLGIRVWGTKDLSKDTGALGRKELKPDCYSTPERSTTDATRTSLISLSSRVLFYGFLELYFLGWPRLFF